MGSVRRLLAMLFVAIAVAAGLGVTAAPAHAELLVCDWDPGQVGNYSTCDGIPVNDGGYTDLIHACDGIWARPYTATIRDRYGNALATIELLYIRGTAAPGYSDGVCRLAAASIIMRNDSASCYVKVERNSDRQAYRTDGNPSYISRVTQVVYDAGVSSYAWGYCSYNGRAYTAGTPSY